MYLINWTYLYWTVKNIHTISLSENHVETYKYFKFCQRPIKIASL